MQQIVVLEGHSYTYEGSLHGKIVDILIQCKTMNPVIYFDELDKISDTPKGEEIVGILTHLTIHHKIPHFMINILRRLILISVNVCLSLVIMMKTK